MASFSEMIDSYVGACQHLRASVAGMSKEHLTARPVPERWSTLEVVAHIADFEPILADRMKRVIALDRPLLLVADENLFASKLIYQERDLEEELSLIEITRKQMARILKSLPSDAAIRTGVHTQKGLISLETILTAAANHIPHHIKFIQQKRIALGV